MTRHFTIRLQRDNPSQHAPHAGDGLTDGTRICLWPVRAAGEQKMLWVVALVLLHCSAKCKAKLSAITATELENVKWPASGAMLSWRGRLFRPVEVGLESAWINGFTKWNSAVYPRLLANVCFTSLAKRAIRPATLDEIDEILQETDPRIVPSACLNGNTSVRAAAIAAGAATRQETFFGSRPPAWPFAANGGMAKLDGSSLEIAQREYASLLGSLEKRVPLEQTVVIRRPVTAPRHSMLLEIVVKHKDIHVYENLQIGFLNKRVESDGLSDQLKTRIDQLPTTSSCSVEGDEIVYIDNDGRFTDIFEPFDEALGKTEHLEINVKGRTFTWKPRKDGRFLNPQDHKDWKSGLDVMLDPSLYKLFALAPWSSDESGKKLKLDIDGACTSSDAEYSDLKAVALIVNRLENPLTSDGPEARNAVAIHEDVFFTVSDEVNPTVTNLCKNRVPTIKQAVEFDTGLAVRHFFTEDVAELRPKSGTGRRLSAASKESRTQALPGRRLDIIRRVLVAMSDAQSLKMSRSHSSIGGSSQSRKISRSKSRRADDRIDWSAVDACIQSERHEGMTAKSGRLLLNAVHLKGSEADLWHLRRGFGEVRNEATKWLLKNRFTAKKHQFILQASIRRSKDEVKMMVKEFVLSKEACDKADRVKGDGPSEEKGFLFEVNSQECLDSIFELYPRDAFTRSPDSAYQKYEKFFFIRPRTDLPGVPVKKLHQADYSLFDIRSVYASGCYSRQNSFTIDRVAV